MTGLEVILALLWLILLLFVNILLAVSYYKLYGKFVSAKEELHDIKTQLDRYWAGEDFAPPGYTKGK